MDEFLIPSNKTLTDVDVFSKTTFLVIYAECLPPFGSNSDERSKVPFARVSLTILFDIVTIEDPSKSIIGLNLSFVVDNSMLVFKVPERLANDELASIDVAEAISFGSLRIFSTLFSITSLVFIV